MYVLSFKMTKSGRKPIEGWYTFNSDRKPLFFLFPASYLLWHVTAVRSRTPPEFGDARCLLWPVFSCCCLWPPFQERTGCWVAGSLGTAWSPLRVPSAGPAPRSDGGRSQWRVLACRGGLRPPGRRAGCPVGPVRPVWASRTPPAHARGAPRCRSPLGGRCRSGAQRCGRCPRPLKGSIQTYTSAKICD